MPAQTPTARKDADTTQGLADQRSWPARRRKRAWLPIPILLLVMVALWVADVRVIWPVPFLYGLVHYGSAALAIALIVIPAARSFLATGQAGVLMLGCGVLMSEIGVIVMPAGFMQSSDTAFAIYNTSVLLSALCHFAGVTITARRKIRLSPSATWLTAAYAGSVAAMGLVVWGAFTGRMPLFFIEGQGGTLLRSLVVGTAVALFLLTAGLLWQANRRAASPFFYWYALGLILLAAGLTGSMAIAFRDSPLQWATRFTQFFGLVYMCVAVLAAARGSRTRQIPLAAVEEAWRENEFLARLRPQTPLGWVLRYGLAVVAVAVAFGIRVALTAWVGPGLPPYITFYPAVMAVALLAGFGPGVVATALMGLVAGCWLLPPVGQFAFASPVDRLGLVIFTGMGLLMSVVAELYRRSQDKAAAYDREAALRESDERYHVLFNTMDEGFCIIEMIFDAAGRPADYRFLEVNAAFEKQTGLHEAEGKLMRELAPAHEAHWFEIYGKIALTGEPAHFMNEARALGRWYDVHAYRVGEPENRQVAIVFNDISGYKRAEAALQQKEAELREAQRIAHVGSWYWDAQTDVTSGSDEFLRIYGLDPTTQQMVDFKSKRGTLYPVHNWERLNAAMQRTMQTGVGYELDMDVRRSGATTWITTRGEIVRDADGQIVGLRGTIQDITQRKRAEEELRTTLQRFYTILSSMYGAILLVNDENQVEFANQAFCDLFGLQESPADAVSIPAREMIEKIKPSYLHPEACVQRIKEILREDQPVKGEEVSLRNQQTCLRDFIPISIDGKSYGRLWHHMDITERKRMEEALRESERRYSALFANKINGMAHCRIITDEHGRPVDYWILQINEAYERIIGIKKADIEGRRVRDVFPEIGHYAFDYIGVYGQIALEGGEVKFEEFFEATGQYLSIYAYSPLPGEFAAIFTDVTERKRAEEQLSELTQRLTYHMDYSPLAVIEWGADMRLTRWSGEAESIFGWKAGEVLGKRMEDFRWIYIEDKPQVAEVTTELQTGANPRRFSANRNYRKDGSVVDCEWYSSSLLDESGKLRSILSLVLDVTKRKEAEEALRVANAELAEADRRKDEFLAMLAHELRNPLAPVRNAVHILRAVGSKDPAAQRQKDVIDRQVTHMAHLLDDLLDVSRVTCGKIVLEPQPLPLIDVLAHAIEIATPLIQNRRHKLTYYPPTDVLLIEGDLDRLAQVFGNLLTNAAKYTGDGGQIWLEAVSEDGRAVVRVRDNGVGIETELLPRVFDLFAQADHSLSRAQGGLGIGLTMVKRLVEMHGGTVEVRSEGLDKGSEFVVRLPALPQTEDGRPSEIHPQTPQAAGSVNTPARRVLVVDDIVDTAQSLAELLTLWGHEARAVHSGLAALEVAGDFCPDMVLLDIGMSGMDGFEAARRLRAKYGPGLELVALTGYGQTQDRAATRAAGFNHHLVKPVDLDTLRGLLAPIRT